MGRTGLSFAQVVTLCKKPQVGGGSDVSFVKVKSRAGNNASSVRVQGKAQLWGGQVKGEDFMPNFCGTQIV